jgi:hypothetical protein
MSEDLRRTSFWMAGVVSVMVVGCQGSADVRVAFENRASSGSTGQALTLEQDGRAPTVFGIRIVAAYLAEYVAPDMNNVGEVGRIWTNPVCDPEGYNCSITAASGPNQVKEYFDLALPTEEVNARLNSQGATIKPGTYRYLRFDMAGVMKTPEQTTPNMHFGVEGSPNNEVRTANNYLVKLEPPMVLEDGDSVVLNLGYDLRGSYFDGPDLDAFHPPAGASLDTWYCGDHTHDPARGPCLRFNGFTPTVTQQKGMAPPAK